MGTRRRIILKIFLFIIAGLLILRPKDVFSYDENNKRTESISQGILSSLQKADVRTEPFIEYLDVQRLPDHTINRSLQELYFMKYFPSHLRVIICEGDHAFRFLVRQGATVFPTVPVVFTGVSDVSILPNSLRKRFTGTPPSSSSENSRHRRHVPDRNPKHQPTLEHSKRKKRLRRDNLANLFPPARS